MTVLWAMIEKVYESCMFLNGDRCYALSVLFFLLPKVPKAGRAIV